MIEEKKEQQPEENVAPVISCLLSEKPEKPAGMGINAYCPCDNTTGKWGNWIDPHIA